MPTVLICDDLAELRRLFRRILRKEPDIEVIGEATDGRQAVEMAIKLRPDVILLDVLMPVSDGLQALEEIRRVSPSSKVIMLTGLNESSLGDTAAELGADDYIEKGASFADIAARIRKLTA